ncbi:putative AAA domain-containing protein [Smittium mucronatum]|uniref:Peroxisomal ATPase PEX1 n=1 Tax=Smittium mucronatum TaxID=133383 RepID=A0A1R0GTI0_9FUNG|nr:putative AAA domain-containing protein [Smittium mucronatum]
MLRYPPAIKSDFDKKIYRHLSQMLSDEPADENGRFQTPKTAEVLDYIYQVDISMKRQKRAIVEKSIHKSIPLVISSLQKQNITNTSDPISFDSNNSMDFDETCTKVNFHFPLIPLQLIRNGFNTPKRTDSEKSLYLTVDKIKNMTVKDTNNLNNKFITMWNNKAAENKSAQNQSADENLPTENSTAKKRKRSKSQEKVEYTIPSTRLDDLGGVESCIEDIVELIIMPIRHPEIYLHTGIQPPRGVLLWGPPGCGKSMMAKAIAGEANVPLISISAPEMVSGMSGESEKKIRELFTEAKNLAPCILFIDEIDAITQKRENASKDMERRMVAQLLTCIDELNWDNTGNRHVSLLGATNQPDSLDPALRRAGRFDREIAMTVPNEIARTKILAVLGSKLRLQGDVNYKSLAKMTPGYVGADLLALTTAAGMSAVRRIFKSLYLGPNIDNSLISTLNPSSFVDPADDFRSILRALNSDSDNSPVNPANLDQLFITQSDFIDAIGKVQPSAQREGFATVPGVTWDSVGALFEIREELRMAVTLPIKNPELFQSVGISAPSGVLLWGPPGCGKTLLAKAVANECSTNFISVKGPELINKYVGESERALRTVFNRARASSPCIIFFDEFDAICPKRNDSSSESIARMVNTLLTELDGVDSRNGVFVIGATNRPDIIDPAILRPGRLDKLLYVKLPSVQDRVEILKSATRNTPLATNPDYPNEFVDLEKIGTSDQLENFSGADINNLVREASVNALKRSLKNKTQPQQDINLTQISEIPNNVENLQLVEDSNSYSEPQSFVVSEAEIGNSGSSDRTNDHSKDNSSVVVTFSDFQDALKKISSSVSHDDLAHYERLSRNL